MKKYSVLLLYPDYIAENYGEETYLAHVFGINPSTAVVHARIECAESNEIIEDVYDLEDFKVLAMFKGHHVDLSVSL